VHARLLSLLSRCPADSLFGHQLPHTAARYAAHASAVQAGAATGPDAGPVPPALTACVRELGSHPRLAPIVARIHEEATALALILGSAAAHLQRLDEERQAQAAVDAAGPSPMDAALAETAAALDAESGRSGTDPADPVAAAAASTRSLRALYLFVAGVMAARRAAAELAGDDGQRAHFDGLYRQLLADAASAHDLRAREWDWADEEMMRRLAKVSRMAAGSCCAVCRLMLAARASGFGNRHLIRSFFIFSLALCPVCSPVRSKTTAQRRVLESALSSAALLSAFQFQQCESDRQASAMAAKLRLREERRRRRGMGASEPGQTCGACRSRRRTRWPHRPSVPDWWPLIRCNTGSCSAARLPASGSACPPSSARGEWPGWY